MKQPRPWLIAVGGAVFGIALLVGAGALEWALYTRAHPTSSVGLLERLMWGDFAKPKRAP